MSIELKGIATLFAAIALLGAQGPGEDLVSITFERINSIPFQQAASPTDRKHLPETMGSGVALLDIDGDGRLDIFFVNGADTAMSSPRKMAAGHYNRLYRNLGNWRFEDVTDRWGLRGEGFGMGVAVGDYDNDGRADLYVTGVGRNYLYRNTGSRFVEIASRAGVAGSGWSAGAAFVDYDRDGRLDLFISRYLEWDWSKSRWCGEGEGAPRSYCHPREFGKISHLIFRNLGNGSFEDMTQGTGVAGKPGKGLGVKIEDVNGDGWPDILVASDSVAQQLFVNRSAKSFDEVALKSGIAYDENGNTYAGMGIDSADVNGDAQPEIIINALARQGYWLYKHDGDSRFSVSSGSSGLIGMTEMHSGWGMRLADFDNDGWPDLVVAQGHVMDTIEWSDPGVRYREPPLLAKNVHGTFFDTSSEAGSAFMEAQAGRGLATGDLDDDGRLDIVISNNNAPPTILRNTTARQANWIAVRLEGTRSNRDGYGSSVIVTTDSGRRLRAFADTSGSYLSANSPVLHFGLGRGGKATQIDIVWPSGVRTAWKGSTSNRVLRLREQAKPQAEACAGQDSCL